MDVRKQLQPGFREIAAAASHASNVDDPVAEINRVGNWLCDLYALDLDLDTGSFLVSPGLARAVLPARSPRSGVLAIEEGDELQLGVYLDPRDRRDRWILVEETSHLVCLAWHADRDLQVSGLVLELQAEIDRFLYQSHLSGQLCFERFESGRFADWVANSEIERYAVARDRAHLYCRKLVQRFARRRDTVGLARELRRFYRAAPSAKLSESGRANS
jgi:hypothetical protein